MKKTKYVAEWFKHGDADLKAAEILLREGGPAHVICFHAQQIGEKYLKGYVAAQSKSIRKIHQLDELLNECEQLDHSFESLRHSVFYLAEFYIETRYPGDIPEVGIKTASKAVDAAKELRDFVLKKF
ncbi:HEPN domain-containing protein [Candidatus Uhrbacteria bacterium]|nr:HEPN domain-containing protein [Candidatus Uhrbacteria bacterium]